MNAHLETGFAQDAQIVQGILHYRSDGTTIR